MNILITGITGFAGGYLTEYLSKERDVQIFGLKRWHSSLDHIRPLLSNISLIDGDLGDPHSIERAVVESAPDVVFHLAAQSYVPVSFAAPQETMHTNAIGTIALLEAIRRSKRDPTIHLCTSSEVYGEVPENELPINEATPFRPQSPYAVSKVAQDMLGYQYHASYGMRIIRSRTFTQTGPGSKEFLVLPAFAKQLAQLELDRTIEPVIAVGNLDSVRTFCDIRDMVRAYVLLVERCTPGGVYNIAGVHTCTIGEMLQDLIDLTDLKPKIRINPKLLRPSDVTRQITDGTKFNTATGWQPEIPFVQTLQDTLDYWRREVRRRAHRPTPGWHATGDSGLHEH